MANKSKLISITKCAHLLGEAGDSVARQSLSEYCDSHSLKIGGTEKRPLVNFDQVHQHRGANGMRRIMKGEGLPPTPVAKTEAEPPRLPSLSERREDPVFRKREAEAALAQIALEKERSNLVLMAEVEAGIAATWAALREAESGALNSGADGLVRDLKLGNEGRHMVKRAMKAMSREMQTRFYEEAVTSAAGLSGDDRAQVGNRLMGLAQLAHRWRRGGRAPDGLAKVEAISA